MGILDNWSARRLTLLGKITIIKTLAVSQIVYILSSLPTPPDIHKTIDSILYDFLWDGKGDKIKRTTMINNYAKGGLKMLDIQSFNESLKMKWIQGYLNEENKGKWKLFFDHYLGKCGGKLLFRGNLKQQDSTLLNLKDPSYSTGQNLITKTITSILPPHIYMVQLLHWNWKSSILVQIMAERGDKGDWRSVR